MTKFASELTHRKFQLPTLILIIGTLIIGGAYFIHKSHAFSADINGDGHINITDLSILAANYGHTGATFAKGDINGDGVVNIIDLSALAAQWGGTGSTIGVQVPASIDATGAADVTILLNSFLASVANNSTINFPVNGRYRIEGTLLLSGKTGITLEGNNATFFATTNGLKPLPPQPCNNGTQGTAYCNPNRNRSQWDFEGNTNLIVKDMNTIGSANDPGPNGTYLVAYEAQNAYNIGKDDNVTLDNVTAKNSWGDLVYIGAGSLPATNVTVENSTLDGASRQCFSITNGDHITVQNNSIGMVIGCRRSMFDLEVNGGSNVITNIMIKNNNLGMSRFDTFNSGGSAPAVEHDITIDHNLIHGHNLSMTVIATAKAPRSNYTITNNVGSGGAANEPIISFTYVNNATISGNTQAFSNNWPARTLLGTQAPVWTDCSKNINLTGNSFTGLPAGMPDIVFQNWEPKVGGLCAS